MALFASLLGILVNSFVIDTLHWRHFWVLLGIIIGLMHLFERHGKNSLLCQH